MSTAQNNNVNKEENSNEKKELQVKVKHIIEYLTKNFDQEAEVELDRDGWMPEYFEASDEIDLIDKRGIFTNFKGVLYIEN